MEKLVEQRVCLKFCVSNEISGAEYKLFKENREVIVDLPRSGRPSTSTYENIDKIKKLVLKNHRISFRVLAEEMNISVKSINNIMTDILVMKRVATRLVPKKLNFVQKEYSSDMAPCNFFLFSKLKLSLRERRFESIEAIKEKLLR
ncbi:hypothetical protein ALC53_01423 [Atta colombica]|uniref:Histone-lysine N-methyltransferase SETMAR n=1 Tax=Atta colombica TaxID=520822 RepID=A0A195BTR1_9HYME|nr:hypothetical protein ALC53_01423 [Atta colombica]